MGPQHLLLICAVAYVVCMIRIRKYHESPLVIGGTIIVATFFGLGACVIACFLPLQVPLFATLAFLFFTIPPEWKWSPAISSSLMVISAGLAFL